MTATSKVEVKGSPRQEGLPEAADQKLLLPGQHERLQRAAKASHFLIPVGTHWVERDVLGVSEQIAREFPNLAVVSCSCNRCLEVGHYPHMVVEYGRDGDTHPVFGFVKFGRHIIEQLRAIHVSNSQDRIEQMQRHNEKVLADKRNAVNEKREQAKDIIASALESPKHDWSAEIDGRKVRTDPYSKRGRVL